MKHFLWSLFLVFMAATPAWSKPEVITLNRTNSVSGATITFLTGDVEDSPAIGVSGYCTVRYQQASGDDAALYAVTTSTAAASSGTLLVTFLASTSPASPAFGFTSSTQWVKAKATDATAGGSVMTIECAPQVGSGSGATQPSPSSYAESIATWAQITDPASTNYGFGIAFEPNPTGAFSAKTYPGGATTGNEPDNQIGMWYNKGLDGDLISYYEHAFDDSWELSYRDTTGTGDETWVEHNIDVFAPTNTATLSSIGGGFAPAVGSYVTFSGGGTGRVLSWSNPTLVWTQFYGKTAAGETVAEAATPADTAILGTPARVTTYAHRPYLMAWRTASNKTSHQWSTEYGGPITMKMQNGNIGINTDDQIVANLEVHGANSWGRNILGTLSTDTTSGGAAADGFPVAWFQYEGELHPTTGNTGAEAQWNRMDYTSLASSASVVDYGKALTIKSPLEADNATDVYQAFGLYVEDQRAAGNNHGAAIFIESQDCRSNAACSGLGTPDGWHNNLQFAGGTWSTGHLQFDAGADYSSGHDTSNHIWVDDTKEVFRVSVDDAPDAETDGVPIVTGTNSAIYGPAIWGISNGGTFDTGDEVCQSAGSNSGSVTTGGLGMTCQDVLEFSIPATPTDSTCSTTHANTVKFIAFCK